MMLQRCASSVPQRRVAGPRHRHLRPPGGRERVVAAPRPVKGSAVVATAAAATVPGAAVAALESLGAAAAAHVGAPANSGIKQLTGVWSSLIAEHLAATAPQLSVKTAYMISHGVGHLVIPLLEALLVIGVMKKIAAAATAWCKANPDRPVSREVLGLLPSALTGPTVVTVYTMLTVRLLRNAAYITANLVHMTDRSRFNKALSSLIDSLADALRPLDKFVVKAYFVISLLFMATVLANWKSIGFTFLLERERKRQEAAAAAAEDGEVAQGRQLIGKSMEELERLVVPLDAATNWLIYTVAIIGCAQVLGLDIAPLVAVGGAGSIILGLATQQLLTNAVMGLSLFFTRPFVNGDSVLVQGGGVNIAGVVENTTVMRTTLRTDDDVSVTVPNKMVADMIVFNRSADVTRSRLAQINRQTENVKLRLKLPYSAEGSLRDLQETVKAVLEPPPGSSSSSSRSSSAPSSPLASLSEKDDDGGSGIRSRSRDSPSSLPAAAFSGHPVAPNSVEVVLSRFTDAGLELLVKAKLRAEPSSPQFQALLLELSRSVRRLGATMVNL